MPYINNSSVERSFTNKIKIFDKNNQISKKEQIKSSRKYKKANKLITLINKLHIINDTKIQKRKNSKNTIAKHLAAITVKKYK